MKKPNVLIIAQDTGVQEQFKNILAEEYEHLFALNGIDGVAVSRMAQPAVVVLDASIPAPKAMKVCQTLSSHDAVSGIPVILLSDSDVRGELSSLPNFGGILKQPLQGEQVRSKIQEAIERKSAAGQKAGAQRDEPIRVLSVDDSSVVRKLVTMILTAEGFKVTTASDGLDGINKAKETIPDIILLDFVMPKMNGFQVCRILQKDEALKNIPVILVTSKGDKVGDKFVNQLGVTGYITKPFQPEELVSKIHSTLEAPKEAPVAPPAEAAAAPEPQQAPAPPPPAAEAEPAPPQAAPAAKPAVAQAAPAPSTESIKQIVQDVLAAEFEEKIHGIVKTELSKFMKSLDKRIEKHVIEKMNEYIRRAKKK